MLGLTVAVLVSLVVNSLGGGVISSATGELIVNNFSSGAFGLNSVISSAVTTVTVSGPGVTQPTHRLQAGVDAEEHGAREGAAEQ